MKLLIDECVSRQVCAPLEADSHDVVHVARDLAMTGDQDSKILAFAKAQDRVVISADTDFPALLAANGDTKPSVILVREIIHTPPAELGKIIAAQLRHEPLAADLERGVVAAIRRSRISVRDLPLPAGNRTERPPSHPDH